MNVCVLLSGRVTGDESLALHVLHLTGILTFTNASYFATICAVPESRARSNSCPGSLVVILRGRKYNSKQTGLSLPYDQDTSHDFYRLCPAALPLSSLS